MFQRLYELSQLLPTQAPWQMLNEGMPENYDRGLAVCFDRTGRYTGVRARTGNDGVVYRSGPPNGTDLTPCSKLAKEEKNVLIRLGRALKDLSNFGGLTEEKKQWLEHVQRSLEQHFKTIVHDLITAKADHGINIEHRGYVYIARYEEAHLDALYSWPESKAVLVAESTRGFAEAGEGKDCRCCVCGLKQPVLFGNFSVLSCYNLDKPGSIAGGFDREMAVKNFPVCQDCSVRVAYTIQFVDDHLTSSVAGQNYLILPYASNPELQEYLVDTLKTHPDRFHLSNKCDLLAAGEEQLFKLLLEEGGYDQMAFALVFFVKDNAAWRIQAEIQQVLPSRLKQLYEARHRLAQDPVLFTVQGKGKGTEEKPFNFTTMTIRTFTGSELDNKTSAALLRAWLAAIFEGRTIERRPFLRQLVRHLLAIGRKKRTNLEFERATRQAWAVYLFARAVQLIPQGENAMPINTPKSAFGAYVEEHQDFFNRPEVMTAFLTGCYANTVAGVQRRERGADPFTKKFLGRLLTRDHLRRIYREGHDKLAQYRKLGIVATSLDPDLAASWVECGDHWNTSDEETTFAFTLGYSLAYRIRQLAGEVIPEEDTSESE